MALPPDLIGVLLPLLPISYFEQHPILLTTSLVDERLAVHGYRPKDIVVPKNLTPSEQASYRLTIAGLIGYQAQMFLPSKVAVTAALVARSVEDGVVTDLLQRPGQTGSVAATYAAFQTGNLLAATWSHMLGSPLIVTANFLAFYILSLDLPAQSYFAQPFTNNFLRQTFAQRLTPIIAGAPTNDIILRIQQSYDDPQNAQNVRGYFLRRFLNEGRITFDNPPASLPDDPEYRATVCICNIATTRHVDLFLILTALAHRQLESLPGNYEFLPSVTFALFPAALLVARAAPMRAAVLDKFLDSPSRTAYLQQLDFILDPLMDITGVTIQPELLILFNRFEVPAALPQIALPQVQLPQLQMGMQVFPAPSAPIRAFLHNLNQESRGVVMMVCPHVDKIIAVFEDFLSTLPAIHEALSYAALHGKLANCSSLLAKAFALEELSDDETSAILVTLPALRATLANEINDFHCDNAFLLQYEQLPVAKIVHSEAAPERVIQDMIVFRVVYGYEFRFARQERRDLATEVYHRIGNMYDAETWQAIDLSHNGVTIQVQRDAQELARRQIVATFLNSF